MQNVTGVFEYKSTVENSLKDVDRGKREMIGMFSAYKSPDMLGDVSHKGMFDKSWKETKSRVKHVFEHDMSKPIGKIQELWDDTDGAYYKSIVGTHKFGDDILEMADSGLLNEHSFGYKTVRGPKNKHGGRDLLEVKHFEVTSVSGWAVHGNTPLISLKKSIEVGDLLDKMEIRYKSLEKFCRNSTASDETIEYLLLEIKQLQQNIIELSTSSTPAAEQAPEPQKGMDHNAVFLLNASIQNQLLKFSN